MLTAEVLRLAAHEALLPTAALEAQGGFPTIAGDRVFDSRAIEADELDDDLVYTPTVSLYTEDKTVERTGPMASSQSGFATASLVAVCDLAVSDTDQGETIAMPLAGTDPKARLVLGALTAQVRQVLSVGSSGAAFRMIRKAFVEIRSEPFVLPEAGLRFHREIMTFRCSIADDDFGPSGGLPARVEQVRQALPEGSYARGQIDRLAAYFGAIAAGDPLSLIAINAPVGTGDPDDDPNARVDF
ncbi:hypothetical protein [Jiella marina]|uniref:hypothetical protein n=1 Tax=Jiella sp. LLJ827 TaxID=2917712 RepID=UPI00210105B7|nr:hypothetical protein [Jiella sp. LLJ827]MCQ0986405.1 hypothetical protein [Jiella sp. LLJ827]